MSEIIPSSHFSHGAGKGPEERPLDHKKVRENMEKITFSNKHAGTPVRKKGAKTTYKYYPLS